MAHSLAKKLSKFKPGTLFVGVDLGLDKSVAKVIDEHARVLATLAFGHRRDEYDHFHHRLRELVKRHGASGYVVGMEPTGYLWMLLAHDLEDRQVDYYLVNAFTVYKHREGDRLDRSKDDNLDGFTIADLLRTGKYTETRLLHGRYAELRRYVVQHERLQSDIGRQKTLIRCTVGVMFPELASVFHDLTCQTAQAMLWGHGAAASIREMSEDAFIAAVRADACGKRLAVSKLRRAYQLATHSVGLTDGLQAFQLELCLHLKTLRALQAEEGPVRAALVKAFKAMPEASSLLSMPALGALTCATILGEIGDPSNYHNGRQLIKLAGTQPTHNTSGRKTRSKTPMSHKGRSRLRSFLFMACLRLIRVNEDFARDYQQYQTRAKNPLTKMQALGALMNKLLRILWALLRDQAQYDPAYKPAA